MLVGAAAASDFARWKCMVGWPDGTQHNTTRGIRGRQQLDAPYFGLRGFRTADAVKVFNILTCRHGSVPHNHLPQCPHGVTASLRNAGFHMRWRP